MITSFTRLKHARRLVNTHSLPPSLPPTPPPPPSSASHAFPQRRGWSPSFIEAHTEEMQYYAAETETFIAASERYTDEVCAATVNAEAGAWGGQGNCVR